MSTNLDLLRKYVCRAAEDEVLWSDSKNIIELRRELIYLHRELKRLTHWIEIGSSRDIKEAIEIYENELKMIKSEN
jgi:hypothetical protein